MKRLIQTILAALALCLLISAPVMADDTYTIKFQCFYSPWGQAIPEEFARIIEEDSGGRIKVQLFNVGEIASSADVLKALQSGVLDLAYGYSVYFSEMPMANILSVLPMAWMSSEEGDLIYEKYGFADLAKQAYAEQGVTWLGLMWTASYQFLSKTPIASLDDMRKMKIRASGASAKMLQKLGVNTVFLPSEDLYLALQTGQVDAILWGAPFEYMEGKFYEAAGYICNTPVFDPSVCDALMNSKTWEKLPEDLQASVLKGVEFLSHTYYDRGMADNEEALSTVFKDKDTTLSDADIAEMTKAAMEVWEEEAAKGPLNAKAVEVLRQAAKDFGR